VSGYTGTVVLAVGAHPDDLEELGGGTLAALAAAGATVHMATTTGGEGGAFDCDGASIRAVRLAEAAEAAAICGASFTHLGMPDQGAVDDIEARRAMTNLVRRLGVDLLITHGAGDYHPDHRRTHQLVTDVRSAAAVPNFADEPPLARTPDLVYMDTVMGVGFEPHVWIDIGATIETRRRMLAAHRSQVELMRQMYGQDLLAMADALTRLRGQQRGCEFAEGFRGCGTWPAPDGGIRRLVHILDH
jgi:LmbE family N-acetylglucosaminyl deacetylase